MSVGTRLRGAAVVSLLVLVVAQPAARADAATYAPNSLTVTTAEGSGVAADGETISVSGYWTDSLGGTGTTYLYECPASAVPAIGAHLDPTRCDPGNLNMTVQPSTVDHSFSDFLVWDEVFTPAARAPHPSTARSPARARSSPTPTPPTSPATSRTTTRRTVRIRARTRSGCRRSAR